MPKAPANSMFMLQKITKIFYIVFVVVLAVATFVEWRMGTPFVSRYFYSHWWFVALMAGVTVPGLIVAVRKLLRKNKPALMLHISLGVIALGALITHFFSISGNLHLREGVPEKFFVQKDGLMTQLPKIVTLQNFKVVNYPGTDTPMDFVSEIEVENGDKSVVSMNKVLNLDGYRFFQSGFDPDHKGSIFIVNYDVWGMMITYLGYFLFFISLVWVLINPSGRFRKLIRELSVASMLVFMTGCGQQEPFSSPVPTKEQAREFSKVSCFYHDRIVPLNTYATDFCLKLTGKKTFRGMSPEQFLLAWITHPEKWQYENVIKVKYALPDSCGVEVVNGYTSVQSLFLPDGEYRLNVPENQKLPKSIQEINEKLQLIISLTNGEALKIWPIKDGERISWLSSADQMPDTLADGQRRMVREWVEMTRLALDENDAEVLALIPLQIAKLQQNICGETLPSPAIRRLEIAYNRVGPTGWLFKIVLTLGMVLLFLAIRGTVKTRISNLKKILLWVLVVIVALQAIALIVRGLISGTVPISNGYETMLFLALSIAVVGIFVRNLQEILGALCVLLSGFALLVANIGMSNPHITPLMPVLHSPWLSVHVMSVMIAYSLLSVTMVNAVIALVISKIKNDADTDLRFQKISLVLLYPAIVLLGIGIFVGAIWANESWGTYWSWDPKEVWALITMLIYVVPLHPTLFPKLQQPKSFNWYLIFAFSTVLMTYFGVNYLLGGMHSYA